MNLDNLKALWMTQHRFLNIPEGHTVACVVQVQ